MVEEEGADLVVNKLFRRGSRRVAQVCFGLEEEEKEEEEDVEVKKLFTWIVSINSESRRSSSAEEVDIERCR